MQSTPIETTRVTPDNRHILTAVFHALLQKKPVAVAERDVIARSTLKKICEALNAQLVCALVAEPDSKLHARFTTVSHELLEEDTHRAKAFEREIAEFESGALPLNMATLAGENTAVRLNSAIEPLLQHLGCRLASLIYAPLNRCEENYGCIVAVNKLHERMLSGFCAADHALLDDAARHLSALWYRTEHPDATLPERETSGYLARLCKCDQLMLGADYPLNTELLHSIGVETLKRYQILPLSKLSQNSISAAISNPNDLHRIADFEVCTGLKLERKVVCTEKEIADAVARAFPVGSQASKVAEAISKQYKLESADKILIETPREDETLIVNLAHRIIEDAYLEGASDIHIEPFENKLSVRYRIDGVCREKFALPKAVHPVIIARLKIMSELDIAEHRLPQDGRIVFKKFNPKYDLDLRVSIVPANYGESVVMRILDKTKSTLPLDKLGFSKYNLDLYRQLINIPYGMVLHCGPTGSGKSMTLYAALNEINSPEYKIVTAEDPIEYTLPRIVQVQMKADIGLTFARALRCFLRQDPDIILVGEVRDRETAEIAVEAALTGHLLFSTLHTNDAPSTITRLVEIGIEPFLISTTLACICAQRLMRRLCSCKSVDAPAEDMQRLLAKAKDGTPIGTIYKNTGCEKCDKTGYKGRTGVHELLRVTDEMRELISRNASAIELKAAARRDGMRTLFEDSMEKVKAGITSLTEALSVTIPDEDMEKSADSASTLPPQKAGKL